MDRKTIEIRDELEIIKEFTESRLILLKRSGVLENSDIKKYIAGIEKSIEYLKSTFN